MGGLISFLRDIKTVYKDLKITLKLTARIVLKVHGIVEDVEQTVQELKATAKGLSAKVYPHHGMGEVAFDALVENLETKAVSLKKSLLEATSSVFNDDLLRNTQEKWEKVMKYSKQSTEALATVVANSAFADKRANNSRMSSSNSQESILFTDINEGVEENTHSGSIVSLSDIKNADKQSVDEDDTDPTFEILPLEIMDSFWKCDVGTFNIDCVDMKQLQKPKKGGKKRKRRRKKATGVSIAPPEGDQRGDLSTRNAHRRKNKQTRENVALEMIFLIAVLMEGVAASNRDFVMRGNIWNHGEYSGNCRAAEIIELDE